MPARDGQQALVLGRLFDDPELTTAGLPSGSYVLSSSSVTADGCLSWSWIGWRAGCRMYLQPDSAKAARYAVRIQEIMARSGKYRSCGVTVKLRPALWVSLSVRRGIHPGPLADHGHSRIGAVGCTRTLAHGWRSTSRRWALAGDPAAGPARAR